MRGNSDEAALTAVLRSLYQQTWSRVEQLLPKGTRNIIISADAELTFLSFATLLNPAKQFLASAYQLSYVASGRDLLRTTAHPTLGRNLAIFANPDFGASFDSTAAAEPAAARHAVRPTPGLPRYDLWPVARRRERGQAVGGHERHVGFSRGGALPWQGGHRI